MPMSYKIDAHAGIVRLTGKHVVTDRELFDCVRGLRHDPQLAPGMKHLSDMRGIEVDFSGDGIEAVVGILRDTRDRREKAKAAIVVDEDVAFGMARMFQLIAAVSDVHPEFRVFREYQHAVDWLEAA